MIALVAIAGCNAEALPEDDDHPTDPNVEEETEETSSAVTGLTRTSRYYAKQRLPICDDPIPALVPANVGVNFYVWRGPSVGCYIFNVVQAKRQSAVAKCQNVKANLDSCSPAYIFGTGSGGTESQACQAAIRDAQGKSSPGCHARHCKCL